MQCTGDQPGTRAADRVAQCDRPVVWHRCVRAVDRYPTPSRLCRAGGSHRSGATISNDGTIDVAGNEIKVGVNPGLLAAMEQMVPLGRGGTPAEAAGAVYLLCLPQSDYVSAQTLVCGGGFNF